MFFSFSLALEPFFPLAEIVHGSASQLEVRGRDQAHSFLVTLHFPQQNPSKELDAQIGTLPARRACRPLESLLSRLRVCPVLFSYLYLGIPPGFVDSFKSMPHGCGKRLSSVSSVSRFVVVASDSLTAGTAELLDVALLPFRPEPGPPSLSGTPGSMLPVTNTLLLCVVNSPVILPETTPSDKQVKLL